MKRLMILILILALQAGIVRADALYYPDPEIIERTAASVLMVEASDQDGTHTARGSGFVAFSDRILVTCFHVLTGAENITVLTESGDRYPVIRVLIQDEEADVALCLLPDDTGLVPLPLAPSLPRRGEPVTAVGCSMGIMNLVTVGTLSGIWHTESISWLLFSAPVSAGESGGPLLDRSGSVAGIIMGSYSNAQSLNLAAPVSAAQALWTQISNGF